MGVDPLACAMAMVGVEDAVLYVRDVFLVVLVQSFMLCQVGYFYARLRCKTRRTQELVKPPDVGLLTGPIAVIIPVYNEANGIERCLRKLDAAAQDASRICIVVSDSGSSDATMETVCHLSESRSLKASLRTAKASASCPGRGGAIIAGLQEAASIPGAILLFLHADSVLSPNFDVQLRTSFARPGTLMTAFEFSTDRDQLGEGQGPPTGMSLMEFTVNLRSRCFELPFGDQGLAITRHVLEAAGGFPDFPILEEYELVQRLRRFSAEGAGRILTLRSKCFCSPRRWLARPIWRVNWVNQMTMLRYRFGATPAEIYRYYYGHDPPVAKRQ